jgi:dihydroxyacetone kinase-like predicted kinase
MREVVSSVATGQLTVASRGVELDGTVVRRGDWLGLADGVAVAGGGAFEDVAAAVVERLLDGPRELLTLLVGDGAPALEPLLARLAAEHPGLEVDVQDGGQPHYALLLSAE